MNGCIASARNSRIRWRVALPRRAVVALARPKREGRGGARINGAPSQTSKDWAGGYLKKVSKRFRIDLQIKPRVSQIKLLQIKPRVAGGKNALHFVKGGDSLGHLE